jgi:hypothetical protein
MGFNAGTGIVRAIVMDPYLLRDKLTAPRYRSFLEIVLLWLLEDSNVTGAEWIDYLIAYSIWP